MQHKALSIRPFIGAKNFEVSRNFYQELGFQEVILEHNLSYFQSESIGFYLQNAFVKDWIDNTMVFVEMTDVTSYFNKLSALNLSQKFEGVRLLPIKEMHWGRECFLHDPSGILWHLGEFCTS